MHNDVLSFMFIIISYVASHLEICVCVGGWGDGVEKVGHAS